jgi:hypothetical protein
MAAKHKQNASAHACATTTAQAQNRQPRYSLKYLQTAPNSGQHLTRDSEQHLTRDSERRLLPGIAPPIDSQTATRSEHHLARDSEHHLGPPRVSVNYGLTVGITLYPAILRLGDRDCGDSPPMTVCALRHTAIWAYADMRLEAYNDIVICAYAHRRIKAYNGSVIRFYDFITIKFQNFPIDTTLAGP